MQNTDFQFFYNIRIDFLISDMIFSLQDEREYIAPVAMVHQINLSRRKL